MLSRGRGISLIDALRDAHFKKNGVGDFLLAIDSFKKGIDGSLPLHKVTQRLIEDTGYIAMLTQEGGEEALERIHNLHELISAIKDFELSVKDAALSDFLDHVALITDLDAYDNDKNRVTLMTMHSAKGLEFPFVFMAGMEEGLFPHDRSLDSQGELEEERRLCYVGMTRAMERLFLSSAQTRTLFAAKKRQMRSRFINEIDHGFIDTSWRKGMQVRHPLFGLGTVTAKEGAGQDAKLTVRFSQYGTKKLIVRYAGLMPA
ncbi:MAG: ATP-binding domain-containing protein, partial [Deltaproteobacteria bacterium]|nr:ATP-binding domain-containing protein [Deltaproteobacteria bacterium]